MTSPPLCPPLKTAWIVMRRTCLLPGVLLCLTQCNPSGGNGELSPMPKSNPELEREAVENLLTLYRIALLQGDIDRLQELTYAEAPVESNAHQKQLLTRQEDDCTAETNSAQVLLDCMADTFRRGTVLDVNIPVETIEIASDRSRVAFVEYQTVLESDTDRDPTTLASRTRAFRVTFDLVRGDQEGTATFRIASFKQGEPFVEVSTPGQVLAGALTRIDVVSQDETSTITAVDVEVPETEIKQALNEVDAATQPPVRAIAIPTRFVIANCAAVERQIPRIEDAATITVCRKATRDGDAGDRHGDVGKNLKDPVDSVCIRVDLCINNSFVRARPGNRQIVGNIEITRSRLIFIPTLKA